MVKKMQGQMGGGASLRLSVAAGGPPAYRQLVDQMVVAIREGRLAAGERLPSSRQLADTLGVSRTTTARALDQLLAEGYAISRPRRGLFVAAEATGFPVELSVGTTPEGSRVHPRGSRYRLASTPDYRCFPARAWAASLRRSWLNVPPEVLNGEAMTGLHALKSAVADYLYRVRGLRVNPSQVLITGGNRDGVSLVCHALKQYEPGASWWVESPSYPPLREAVNHHVGSTRWLPLDEAGLCLPARGKVPAVVVATPCRQFPLGIGMSRERRQEWLARLAEGNTWLVEDDYDNEFRYDGAATLPLYQADHAQRTLLLGSFSKIMFKGLRLGYIVAPPSLCAVLEASQRALGGTASLAVQPALADFMRQGEFGRHLNRMRRHYRQRRDALLALLEEALSPWCQWTTPGGGMHLVVYLKAEPGAQGADGLPLDQSIAQRLKAEDIALDPLSHYYPRDAEWTTPPGFVVGFTDWDEAAARHLLERLAAALRKRFSPGLSGERSGWHAASPGHGPGSGR